MSAIKTLYLAWESFQFSLQLRRRLEKVLHLRVGVLHVLRGIRTLAIPSPLLHQLRCQLSLEHLCDVLSEHGEELVAMEGAACCNVEAFGGGVGRNDKVRGCGECVPNDC